MTVFRIVDSSSEKMEAFFQFQEEQAEDGDGGDNQEIEENVCVPDGEGKMHATITDCRYAWHDARLMRLFPYSKESTSGILETHTALIYDGIMILAEAIKQLGDEQIKPLAIDCGDTSSVWPSGYTLTNFMKSVSAEEDSECRVHIQFDFFLSKYSESS